MKKISLHSILRSFTVLVVLMLWLFVTPITAFFWTLFLIWAVFELDSRIIGYGAITLLVLIPLVLSMELYEWMAEQLAAYVFYLLCITVALQTIELFRDDETEEEKTDENEEPSKLVKARVKKKISTPDYSK